MGRKGNEPCSIDTCEGKELARGWCAKHYARWQTHGDPLAGRTRGASYDGATCSVDGCALLAIARSWCPNHYRRWKLYGSPTGAAPEPTPKTIEQLRQQAYDGAPGGSTEKKSGYRYRSLFKRTYLEHRLVMEHMLGRALYPDETVHHRNGVRSDNRPENLELWSSWQPRGQRVEDKVAWAREVLARYT